MILDRIYIVTHDGLNRIYYDNNDEKETPNVKDYYWLKLWKDWISNWVDLYLSLAMLYPTVTLFHLLYYTHIAHIKRKKLIAKNDNNNIQPPLLVCIERWTCKEIFFFCLAVHKNYDAIHHLLRGIIDDEWKYNFSRPPKLGTVGLLTFVFLVHHCHRSCCH